jgi:hypothetical protein
VAYALTASSVASLIFGAVVGLATVIWLPLRRRRRARARRR